MIFFKKTKKFNGDREYILLGKKIFTYKKSEYLRRKKSKKKLKRIYSRTGLYGRENGSFLFPSADLQAIPTEPLQILVTESPVVSIIIPAYNRIDLNLQCVRSIIRNTIGVSYEIIIADDCSTDETSHIEDYVKGIRRVPTGHTMRFLGNCNNAAKYARGKYICFLNNDTIVQYDWLSPLVQCIEEDSSIGLCGSKQIGADGKLQEAGGIVYRDASANNYGRRKNPDDLSYNYVREVDYISGAAMLLPRELWESLGGFDERFVPAYYEDTDLAFRIRYEKGLKVVYQPASVVMHLEGQSNGMDESQGLKKHQIYNRKVFFDKWKEQLFRYHCSPSRYAELAKDRAQNTKTILVIDFDLLTPFNDTGSRATWQYMQHFREKGFVVKYYPSNLGKDVNLLKMHLNAGFEVISDALESWLRTYGQNIDYIYLNRPEVAARHLDVIRKFTKARVLYQGHDLHYLRQYRARLLEGNPNAESLLIEEKEQELDVCRKVDVACYFSQYEVDILQKEDPYIRAAAVPLFILNPAEMTSVSYNAKERKDLVFVAGFRHVVNIDAAVWFCREVFPLVLQRLPGIKFYIVGSSPSAEVLALAGDNIIVTGAVSEEKLIEFYRETKLAIVPLRAGAGVKGKVIEAIYNKVPVVTTSVGAEGIADPNKLLTVADEPEKLAEAICDLYSDDTRINEISAGSQDFIREFFSTECIDTVFSEFIPEIVK